MPRAGDAYLNGALPRSHDPLQRIEGFPPDIDVSIEDLLDMWRDWFIDIGLPLIEELTGLDLSIIETVLTEGIIAAIVEAITGGGGGLSALTAWAAAIPGLSTVLGWFGLDPGGDETDLISLIASFLTGGSPLNANNLFNIGNLLGVLNIGNISNKPQNMLDNPDFREAISLVGGGIWTYDAVDGKTVPGCAVTTANGVVPRILRSNAIEVAEGDELDLGVSVKWSGLAYTGTAPIKLQVVHLVYNPVTQEFDEGSTVDAVTVASPGANQSTWLDWLDDDYVVPAGVTHICLQLYVGANATTGTVKFDDGLVLKTGLLQMLWIGGLLEQFLEIFGVFGNTTGGLAGLSTGMALLQNLVSNLLSLVGLAGFDLDDLNKSPMLFNPSSFLSTFITNGMNPLNLLEDNIIRNFFKQFLDQITSVLRLIPFVGDSIADSLEGFEEGMAAQTDTVIGTAATTSQILAALGTGNPAADDFERTDLTARWRVIKSNGGSVSVNGHDLVMSHDDQTDFILLDTEELAGSDYQTVEITLGSAPGFDTVLLDSAYGGNDAIVRASNFTTWATRTMVRCRWLSNRNIRLSAWVNGSEVVTLYNATVSSASAGSRLSVQAGVDGNPRRFVIRVNGSVIPNGDIVESGTASQYGASYRYRGLGGRTDILGIPPLAATPDPGKLKQWTATG